MYLVNKDSKSIAAECYRTLKTNLQYSSLDEERKVIVVTSSEPGEGKSTTAANLALTLSQGEKKVILLDCDLRKPTMHKGFQLSNVKGITDLIIGKENLSAIGYKINDNLTVVTSGKIPPNPSEFLGSKAMKTQLDDLRKVFDYVIIDTPPIQAVADAQILSAKADGVILVVQAEKTKKESVKNSIDLLRKVSANIIGTVLNKMDTTKNKYYYYYGSKNKKSKRKRNREISQSI